MPICRPTLQEPLEWFAETEVHLFGQSADIVVALDDLACDIEALYAVGVDGALCEPSGVSYLLCFCIEDIDEALANDLAFLLGL